jgi:hypothetical protein
MRRTARLVGLAALLLTSPVYASSDPSTSRTSDWIDLDHRLVLPEVESTAPLHELGAASVSLDLDLPSLGEGGLFIRHQFHATFGVFVGADMTSYRPRATAVDGESYFSVGLEGHLTPWLTLYLEQFMPTSMVLGKEEAEVLLEPAKDYEWDGSQLSLGARATVGRFTLHAEVMAYVLSESGRDSELAARTGLAMSF